MSFSILTFVPVLRFVVVGFHGVSADFALGVKVSTINSLTDLCYVFCCCIISSSIFCPQY